jgi:hypothetical protein
MLWLIAATLLITGLALLLLGILGRRIGRAPHCRRCSFDLSGVAESGPRASNRCPECGASLATPRAVRVGYRRRWPALALLGAVLASLVVLGGGAMLLSASNPTWNSTKPTWLLMLEATRLRSDARDAAAAELLTRNSKSSLSRDRLAQLVTAALDVQAQAPRNWDQSPWWALLDAAFYAGAVSKDERRRYVKQAFSGFSVRLPELMLASEPWPARVTRFAPSVRGWPPIAPAQPVAYIVTLDRATLDDSPLPLQRSGYDGHTGPVWTASQKAISVSAGGGGLSHFTHISTATLPFANHTLTLSPVSPGEHTLVVEYTVLAFAPSNFSLAPGSTLDLDAENPAVRWPLRIEHEFIARAEPEEISRFARPEEAAGFDPTVTETGVAGLRVQPDRMRIEHGIRLSTSLNREDNRQGMPWIVGRLILRSGDETWSAVEPWPPTGAADPICVVLAPPPHAPQGTGFDFAVTDFPRLDRVDMVIVPDLRVAAVAGIAGPVWPDEIVIQNVPISWMLHPATKPPAPDEKDARTGDSAPERPPPAS